MERRANARYDIWLPLEIDVLREGIAVSHDASKNGMLIVTASQPDVGTKVVITFRLPPGETSSRSVKATVVRVGPNEKDPNGIWPHAVAVQFEAPVPELETLLQLTETPARKSQPPPSR